MTQRRQLLKVARPFTKKQCPKRNTMLNKKQCREMSKAEIEKSEEEEEEMLVHVLQ